MGHGESFERGNYGSGMDSSPVFQFSPGLGTDGDHKSGSHHAIGGADNGMASWEIAWIDIGGEG